MERGMNALQWSYKIHNFTLTVSLDYRTKTKNTQKPAQVFVIIAIVPVFT